MIIKNCGIGDVFVYPGKSEIVIRLPATGAIKIDSGNGQPVLNVESPLHVQSSIESPRRKSSR